MSDANRDLRREHGGMTYYQVLFNLAEYQARKGGDGYRWDGEAWIGGDINRLTLKSEGEGTFGKPLEAAEVQALVLTPLFGARRPTSHERRVIEPLWRRIARMNDLPAERYILRVVPLDELNAFACGACPSLTVIS